MNLLCVCECVCVCVCVCVCACVCVYACVLHGDKSSEFSFVYAKLVANA